MYFKTLLPHIPRIIGQIDRNPSSSTYGCADRNYWHYKLIDTPSARFQEICLTLALLYTFKHQQNIYYHKKKIRDWTLAIIHFWTTQQKNDGSFDEWYPNEKSFVATTFSLFAVTESLLLLNVDSSPFVRHIVRSADWLLKQTEFTACNQHAGACIALWNCFEITGDKKYKTGAEEKWKQLKVKQSPEGWFAEYGGADMGYSSVLVDYLGKYYLKSKNEQVLESMKKLCDFLAICVHPNQTTGGEYGSRNTAYALPDGFEIFSAKIPSASFLTKSVQKFLKKNDLNLDDRYLINNGYTYIQASMNFNPKKLPYRKKYGNFWFKESGLCILSNSAYYCVINLKKGGARKIYDQKTGKLLHEHSGIVMNIEGGTQLSSQFLNHETIITFDNKRRTITISSPLYVVKQIKMNSLTLIGSRLFQLTIGRISLISHFIKKFLRKILITNAKSSSIALQQVFIFHKKNIIIKSTVLNPKPINIQSIRTNDKFSLIYVPSSRYFQMEELEIPSGKEVEVMDVLRSEEIQWVEKITLQTAKQNS